jgi:hypothetical protein
MLKDKSSDLAAGPSNMIEVEPDLFYHEPETDKSPAEPDKVSHRIRSETGKMETLLIESVLEEIRKQLQNGVTNRDKLESFIKKNCGYKIFPGSGFYIDHVGKVLEELGREPLVIKSLVVLMKECLESEKKHKDTIYRDLADTYGAPFTLKYRKEDITKEIGRHKR